MGAALTSPRPVKEVLLELLKRCEQCSGEFKTIKNVGNRQRFCSEICSNKWHSRNRPNKKHLKSYICKYCGKSFIPKAVDRITFCSRDCAFKYRAEQKAGRLKEREIQKEKEYKRICVVCGKPFTGKPNHRYCSDKCRNRTNYLKYKDSNGYKNELRKKREAYVSKPIIIKKCKYCGELFSTTRKRQVFHSSRCAKKFYHKKQKNNENHRRRANLNKVKYENINPIKVYESHNWICGICGKKINPKLKCPHPKSASIDHIIPISKGGTHTYDNVQPAHFICNSFKGDSIENIQLKLCQTA
jgi:hypothetical protein